MRSPINKNTRRCYVDRLGYDPKVEHRVVEYGERECLVENTQTKERYRLYTVFLFATPQQRLTDRDDRIAAANAIGRYKMKPGKHP